MRTLTTPPIYLLLYLLLPATYPPVPKRLMTDPIVRLDRFLCPSTGLTGGVYPRRSSVSPQPIAPRPEGCGHSGAAPILCSLDSKHANVYSNAKRRDHAKFDCWMSIIMVRRVSAMCGSAHKNIFSLIFNEFREFRGCLAQWSGGEADRVREPNSQTPPRPPGFVVVSSAMRGKANGLTSSVTPRPN